MPNDILDSPQLELLQHQLRDALDRAFDHSVYAHDHAGARPLDQRSTPCDYGGFTLMTAFATPHSRDE